VLLAGILFLFFIVSLSYIPRFGIFLCTVRLETDFTAKDDDDGAVVAFPKREDDEDDCRR